jgi:hypothetical protein
LSYGAGDIAAGFRGGATSRDASASVTDRPFGETPQAKSTILKKKLP